MLILDRQTGVITTLATGAGAPAGPAFAQRATRTAVWGVRPGCCVVKFQAFSADNTIAGSTGFSFAFPVPPSGQVLDVPHVDMSDNPTNLGLSWVTSDVNTGGMINAGTALIGLREGADPRADFGDATTPASHPVARRGDGYVALDRTSGSDADIQTISFPSETALTPAPAPITSTQPERMPAWAPGGLQLAFVRTTAGGRRTLPIFDLTPGLQTIVNPAIDIGPDAPTPQTRAFQSSWGGLSIADGSALDIPTVTCTSNCLSSLQTTITKVPLKPVVSTTTRIQTIGIFVVRVTGKRKLLGRTVPRIKQIGRVPLGRTRTGRNSFRWNGKVSGKRLERGTYLLTYRALRGERVVSTSGSIRFKINRQGRIRGVRRVK